MTSNSFQNFLQLIRVIFPNWGFFESIGDQYCLYWQSEDAHWNEFDFKFKISAVNILVNSENNLMMAQKNVLEHFISDYQIKKTKNNIEQLSSYLILKQIIHSKIIDKKSEAKCYKFKITYKKNSNPNEEIFYISPKINITSS